MALISALSLSVTALAARKSFLAPTGKFNAEIREIITFADILPICSHCHGSKPCRLCPILHNRFKFLHVAKILNLYHDTDPPASFCVFRPVFIGQLYQIFTNRQEGFIEYRQVPPIRFAPLQDLNPVLSSRSILQVSFSYSGFQLP